MLFSPESIPGLILKRSVYRDNKRFGRGIYFYVYCLFAVWSAAVASQLLRLLSAFVAVGYLAFVAVWPFAFLISWLFLGLLGFVVFGDMLELW